MNVALVFIFGISIYVDQTCLSLEPSSNEVDILWQKYGDLRSELETMKANRRLDLKKMKMIEKDISSIKNTLGMKPEDTTDGTVDANQQQNDQSVGNDMVDRIPGWETFGFKLLKASIQHTDSVIVFAMEVHVDVSDATFSHYWYDDNIPIVQGDLNYSMNNIKNGTRHLLILVSRHPKEYHENNIIRIMLMDTQLQSFSFRYSDHNITKTYQGEVIYKVSTNPKDERDDVITGNFAIRSNYIRNKKIDSMIYFIGLNETSHQEYEALRIYGFGNSGPWKESLFIQDISVLGDEYQMSNWSVSEVMYKNGGYLEFSISIGRFDDMFTRTTIYVGAENVFTNNGYAFPKQFLATYKDDFPRYLKTNDRNVIYCGAMGRPRPYLTLLRKESRNNHIVPTGYPSVVMKTQYSVFLTSVIPEGAKEVDTHYICAARSGDKEEMTYINMTVVTLSKISNAEIIKDGDNVVIEITVNLGGPSKPNVMCAENEVDGPSIWERDDVYSTAESFTDTTFEMTITANFSGIADPPGKLVCGVYSNYGNDVKTLHLY